MTAEPVGHVRSPLGAVALLRAQIGAVHRRLEASFTQWLQSIAPASPPKGSEIVALYVHAATVEDLAVHSLLLGVAPLFATTWSGRGPAEYSLEDLAPLRRYVAEVFAATDTYLAGLSPASASQTVDLTRLGEGYPTVADVVSRFVILELAELCGEMVGAVRVSRVGGH